MASNLPQKQLSEVVDLNPRLDKSTYRDDLEVSFVPMAAVEAESGRIEVSQVRRLAAVKKGYTPFREGDVLFAKITPCMENGKMAVVPKLTNDLGFGSTEFHVLRPREGVSPRYVYYFVSSQSFRREAAHRMTGAVGQKRVPQSFLEEASIPVPFFEDQQRIVSEIEKQFSRLNKAVASLRRVKANLKRYKAAVLKAAVEGSLVTTEAKLSRQAGRFYETAAQLLKTDERVTVPKLQKKRAGRLWGAGHVPQLTPDELSKLPEGWAWAKVRQLGLDPEDAVQVGPMSMRSEDFQEAGVPVLNVGCVQWGRFDETKLNFLPEKVAAGFSRYRIQPGDVLFTRSGTVGRCAVAKPHQKNWLMTFHLLRARPSPNCCLPEYLRTVFEGAAHIRRQTREASIGTTRSGFNTNLLANLDIPLPPMVEQQRILAEVERRLSVIEELEASVEANLARAERLRQSILMKCFSGR